MILHQSTLELALARQSTEGQQTKTEVVYQYLTGPRFRQRVEAISKHFPPCRKTSTRKKAIMKQWAKRE